MVLRILAVLIVVPAVYFFIYWVPFSFTSLHDTAVPSIVSLICAIAAGIQVWKLLGAVKTQFGKFGDLLDGVQKKLEQASAQIETAARTSRGIERSLKKVEELPAREAAVLLPALETGCDAADEV